MLFSTTICIGDWWELSCGFCPVFSTAVIRYFQNENVSLYYYKITQPAPSK